MTIAKFIKTCEDLMGQEDASGHSRQPSRPIIVILKYNHAERLREQKPGCKSVAPSSDLGVLNLGTD